MSTQTVGVFYAKTHLSAILEKVSQGSSFTLTKHGHPLARIIPISEPECRPRRGLAKSSEFYMAEDFDAPLDDFEEYMG